MKKVSIAKPGGEDQLKIIDAQAPICSATSCRIAVKYAGVNFADIAVRQGIYESAKALGWPITPGFEVSGIITEVGAACTKYKLNDEVWGITKFGGYASEICLEEHLVYPKPKHYSLAEAAAFPTVFMTAYHAIFQNIIVSKGMDVLVHSAAGGVGSSLCQMLHNMGCNVVGIVGGDFKVAAAKQFGATHVIDYKKEDIWKRAAEICPQGFDVIFDAVGPDTLKAGYKQLKPVGKIVSYGFASMMAPNAVNWPKLIWKYLHLPRFNPLDMVSANKSLICFNLSFLFDRKDLIIGAAEGVMHMIEQNQLKAPQVQVFKVEEIGKAHALLASGKSTGKILVSF